MKRSYIPNLIIVAAALALAAPAWAKGSSFSGGGRSSYSAPRTAPRVAPAPRPVTINRPVTVQRTTVVNQTVQQGSSGGGFMSSALGSFAGAGIASWLFNKPAAPAPAAAPVAPAVIDCSRDPLPPEWLQHCPARGAK